MTADESWLKFLRDSEQRCAGYISHSQKLSTKSKESWKRRLEKLNDRYTKDIEIPHEGRLSRDGN